MIKEILSHYHTLSLNDPHHRFKSWEHCHTFFQDNYKELKNPNVFDHGCLHLAFYLASWGMLRGSTFLFQKDYRVHQYLLQKVLLNPQNHRFFDHTERDLIDMEAVDGINQLIKDTKRAYIDNIAEVNGENVSVNVTDTLASKILLGIFGIAPAYDRYFIDGARLFGINTQFNEGSVIELAQFYNHYVAGFSSSKTEFNHDGVKYTPMKLIDMFFWQIGFMMDNVAIYSEELGKITRFAGEYKSTKFSKPAETIKHFRKKTISRAGLGDQIRKYIIIKLNAAKEEGKEYMDIRSGDIQKEMGLQNRIPSVCNAMESLGVYSNNMLVLYDTPSGKSSTKVIRYMLR
ncbi:hypothetical protein ACFVAD_07785 [Sutcliffiella sp. NPDC057660]|uniref:hypothetical protein n=1 Tax=Sutcliffiella sp. NPDC057660 TaxID=3346199 RepID=UPI00368CA13F